MKNEKENLRHKFKNEKIQWCKENLASVFFQTQSHKSIKDFYKSIMKKVEKDVEILTKTSTRTI